jgi:hypothetical protein
VGDGPAVADRLHELRHHPELEHAVEYLYLDVHDLDHKRLRATSDVGTDYAIVLSRDSALADGAVLLLESDRAVVICAGAPRTITLWYWNLIANPNASIEVGDEARCEVRRTAPTVSAIRRIPAHDDAHHPR